jgi:hypothetical protein
VKTCKQQSRVSRLLIANLLIAVGWVSAAPAQDEPVVTSASRQKTPVSTAEYRLGLDLPKEPNTGALQRFIQREYPGFAKLVKQ